MTEMVRIRHPELDVEAVVPRRSLPQMAPGWVLVEEDVLGSLAGEEPNAEAEEAPRPTRRKKED